jgi:predicted ATP-grasp superfamily ATP-dependent carboligase
VLAADNLPFTACSAPGTADGYVRLPRLRSDHRRWIEALIACCRERRVDFLLPVFEETHLIAEYNELIEAACPGIRVFAAEAAVIALLRDKRRLAKLCRDVGVKAPGWVGLPAGIHPLSPVLSSWSNGCVLKPATGYAGEGVILHPKPQQVREALFAHPGWQWMLQEFIPGETICLHAVAHEGTIHGMVLYRMQAAFGPGERRGVGFACVFEPIEDAVASEAATRIISATRYSGHIGFDMIRHGGEVYCVDANPRATAGLHLLELGQGWLETLWAGRPLDVSTGPPCRDLTLLLSRAVWSPAELVRTLRSTSRFREVVHRREEPVASLLLLLIYGYVQLASWWQREHPSLVISRDFAYPSPAGGSSAAPL